MLPQQQISPTEDILYRLAQTVSGMGDRLVALETDQAAYFEVKETTGDPSSPLGNFHFVINTFDNNLRVYADGDWRTLASW